MKKFLLATAFLLASSASYAVTDGHWAGNGEWSTPDGQSQAFQYDIKIAADQITGSWTYNGQAVPYTMRLSETGKFFDVYSGSDLVGSGYTYGNQLHYSAVFDTQGQVEETWTFQGNTLEVLGSKAYQSKKAIWSATLSQQAN
jgi:hypothetical protein